MIQWRQYFSRLATFFHGIFYQTIFYQINQNILLKHLFFLCIDFINSTIKIFEYTLPTILRMSISVWINFRRGKKFKIKVDIRFISCSITHTDFPFYFETDTLNSLRVHVFRHAPLNIIENNESKSLASHFPVSHALYQLHQGKLILLWYMFSRTVISSASKSTVTLILLLKTFPY